MKIGFTRTFPTTRKEGFAFFMDFARWEEWTPLRVYDLDDAKFAKKGDELRVIYRLYGGIPMHGTVVLDKVVAGEMFEATLHFPGMPAVQERFALHGTGTHAFVLEASMEMEDHGWLGTSLQWMAMLPLMIRRDLSHSLDKAHGLFAEKVLERAEKKAA